MTEEPRSAGGGCQYCATTVCAVCGRERLGENVVLYPPAQTVLLFTDEPQEADLHPRCPSCGEAIKGFGVCEFCSAWVRVESSGAREIRFVGRNAAVNVSKIARQLAEVAERQEVTKLRSPWFSGLFYLLALAVVISLLLVVGRVLPVWALPLVIVGAVLLVSVVGALQLRQDDRLSERGFLRLMADVFRRLPVVLARRPDSRTNGPER